MKTRTDARLTLSYVRKLEWENYLALAAVVLLSAVGFCGLLYHVGGSTYPDAVSNIMYPLTSFVGAGWAFITVYRAFSKRGFAVQCPTHHSHMTDFI